MLSDFFIFGTDWTNCTSVSVSFLKWHAKSAYVRRGLEIEVYFRNLFQKSKSISEIGVYFRNRSVFQKSKCISEIEVAVSSMSRRPATATHYKAL